MGEYSGLLYARPSFFEGIARIIDLGGTLNEYNRSPTPEQADHDALDADWRAIGQDMQQAFQIYEASHPELTDGSK